jgi:glycosyltransferase involved in cell wall biosynthesis
MRVSDVLWVTPYWPTDRHPGLGCFVYDLWDNVRGASGQSCPVVVTSPHPRPVPPADGNLVKPFIAGPPWSVRSRLSRRLTAPLMLRRIVEHGDAPIHLHGGTGLRSLLSVPSDRPIFFHIHGQLSQESLDAIGESQEATQRPLILLAVSRHISEKLGLNNLSKSVFVLPNGYNSRLFFRPPKRSRYPEVRVLTVGNLAKHKNISCVIRAVSVLRSLGIPAVLNVVGIGPERRRLTLLARQLGLKDQVVFLGSKTQEQVATLMRESDVFALPSRSEAFGVVFKEALASGLITIGGAGTGATEALGGQGYVVDPNSPTELANVIATAVNSAEQKPDLSQGIPGDWGATARSLLRIYAQFGIA